MSRELWLLRHGKSDREVEMIDFDRPLKKRGKKAAERVGRWMKQQTYIPDVIISSPAKRAFDTATLAYRAIGGDERYIRQDKRLYFQGIGVLKIVLAECASECQKVLLVGHNPDFEALLIYLVGINNMPNEDKLFPTATLARLAMPDNWHKLDKGCAKLLSITYAKTLPDDD